MNGPRITATDFGYTGQRDNSMGLMDYHARFYDGLLGRFVQPDSIMSQPSNPQSWNRFSYVLNDPVRYNDPSGYYCLDAGEARGRTYMNICKPPNLLILACGKETNGGCGLGIKIYTDKNGVQHVPMDALAEQFVKRGGEVVYLDHNTYGSTDLYAQAILKIIKTNPDSPNYLAGHSTGANAIVGALTTYQHQGGNPSQINGVALLDPYLWTGNGTGVGHPADWTTDPPTDLGN